MSDPAFLQFAEQMRLAAGLLGPSFGCAIQHDEALQAERHARLLQRIWEWAQVPHVGTRTLSHEAELIRACKAHVRALLAQSEET